MCEGLDAYLSSIGVRKFSIVASGWRVVGRKYESGRRLDRGWIEENISGKRVEWLNIGWYRRESGGMLRFGGHWLTVVGWRNGKCLVCDPAPRNGVARKVHELVIRPAPEFALSGKIRGLPASSRGMLGIAGGFVVKKGTDLCLIDGAVALAVGE